MHLNQTKIAGNDLAEQPEGGIAEYLCRKSGGSHNMMSTGRLNGMSDSSR
jgi:hypothetical protein